MNGNRFSRLSTLREELAQVTAPAYPEDTWPLIKAWSAKATPIVRSEWSDLFDDFQKVVAEPKGPGMMFMNPDFTISEHERRRLWKIENEKAKEAQKNILNFLDGLLSLSSQNNNDDIIEKILSLCKRFPIFVQQLKARERGRTPLEIEDEYDVQYLFLALLRLQFDDVRKEEWTPNYAGGSSRMDFLLKREKVVIETKKTRDSLSRDSQIGDQLIIDIERYSQYSDCQTLVCFVFDPESLLDNPRGLEIDLSGMRGQINVAVIISSSS